MISFFAFSGLLNFIVSIFLASLVYLKGRKKIESRTFVLFAFSVAFWSFGYFFWQISTEETSALFWSRFLMAGAVFIPIFYFHFIVSFLNLIEKYKGILWGSYGLSLFFFVSNFTSYFVRNVEPELFFPFWPRPGIFFHPFLLMFFGFVVYGWYLLLKALRETKETIRKQQIKYLLLGTGIGFICGSTNYFLWYGIPAPPYLNILVSIYVVLTALAILKYHLFEIRVILTEILVGAMGVLLLVFSFLLPEGYKIFGLGIFLLFCIFAYYLIKATHGEARRREEAESLAKEVKRLDEAKSQFMMATQHHMRTPLTSIQGYLSMLLEGTWGEINQIAKSKIKGALESTQNLIRLVNEFLDINKFELGKEVITKKETQLETIIQEVVKELKPEAEKNKLYLKFEKAEFLPKIMADPEKLKEAIYNVVLNGIKYTLKGGVTIKLRIQNEKLKIEISDTGIGMTKEESRGLFEKTFERGKEAKKLYTTGRGIGLYLASQIIRAHQGKIWAESPGPDKGSIFYIELPI